MKNVRIVDILRAGQVDSEITVKGWVRTRRSSKNVNFIALNDGSTINNLQIVADYETYQKISCHTTVLFEKTRCT